MSKKKEKDKTHRKPLSAEKAAVIWTRVSTKDQAENNLSLDTQYKACEEYAQRNGITIIKSFGGTFESAKSEGSLFKEMIAEVSRDTRVNMILTYSYDRFRRSGPEGMLTKQYLKAKGIFVTSITQAIDPESAVGEFMENIIYLFNEFENNLRRDKCRSGMVECLEKGDWYSKLPVGFSKVHNPSKRHDIRVNEKGELLRKAFMWKATEEITDAAIAERLKNEGFVINRKRLSEVFHNPFYCGKIKHSLLGGKIVNGNQEVLIDEATFNKVNGISTHINYTHSKETPDFPLKKHVKCSECGGSLTGYTVNAKGKKYYKCNTIGCKLNKSTDRLHELYALLLDQYRIPEILQPILRQVMTKALCAAEENQKGRISELKGRETILRNDLRQLILRSGKGLISQEVYEITRQEIDNEISSVQAELGTLNENASNLSEKTDHAISIACKLGDIWRNGSFDTCQKAQKLVYPDGIYWDKDLGDYRTISENKALAYMHYISENYSKECTKKEGNPNELSSLVAGAGLEPATFGL